MIIAVASGKGGTGKTLIATSLALSLQDKVQLIDCDVEEPNAHIFLKPVITKREGVFVPVPCIDEEKCTHCGICSDVCAFHAIVDLKKKVLVFPDLCHGCGACTCLCPEGAISETGKEIGVVESGHTNNIQFTHGLLSVGQIMSPPVIGKAKEQIDSTSTVIIDAPPGTSCPVVESIKGSDFCLLVTEPTPFGLNDLVLAVGVLEKLGIPHGVVLNRAGVGDNKVEEYCLSKNIPVMLTIPLDNRIAGYYSKGIPLVKGMPEWRDAFVQLHEKIRELLNNPLSC